MTTTFTEVDPTLFKEPQVEGYRGRSAWTKRGFPYDDYRFKLSSKGEPRCGAQADKNLDYWAVSAGVNAIRMRLQALSLVDEAEPQYVGNFGTEMDAAVREFQKANKDVSNGRPLAVDGVVGRTDSQALWTPVIDKSEESNSIPDHILRGMINLESVLDVAAIGTFVWYPVKTDPETGEVLEWRYGGVDRGLQQNNSKANPGTNWTKAFDPYWAINDAGSDLKQRHDFLKGKYPGKVDTVYWDAAICSHNSPSYGDSWARMGGPPNSTAATYVANVRKAIY